VRRGMREGPGGPATFSYSQLDRGALNSCPEGGTDMLQIDRQGMVIQDARIIARRAKGIERSQIYRVCGIAVYQATI
jgi:hypothetical protein